MQGLYEGIFVDFHYKGRFAIELGMFQKDPFLVFICPHTTKACGFCQPEFLFSVPRTSTYMVDRKSAKGP